MVSRNHDSKKISTIFVLICTILVKFIKYNAFPVLMDNNRKETSTKELFELLESITPYIEEKMKYPKEKELIKEIKKWQEH